MRVRVPVMPRQGRIRSDLKQSNPLVRILQGLFIAAVGVVIIIVNLNTGMQFQKASGHITEIDENMANGTYNATNLSIDNSDDIFVFNKDNFTPVWSDRVYKRQKVDIYYLDGTPKKVVAIVLYDPFGTSSSTFTTPDYDAAVKGRTSGPSIGIIVGSIIALLGWLWVVRAIWLMVVARTSRPTISSIV